MQSTCCQFRTITVVTITVVINVGMFERLRRLTSAPARYGDFKAAADTGAALVPPDHLVLAERLSYCAVLQPQLLPSVPPAAGGAAGHVPGRPVAHHGRYTRRPRRAV